MMDIGHLDLKMDKVHSITNPERNTQGSFNKESVMEEENTNGLTQRYIIKVNSSTGICMVEGANIGKTVLIMTGSGITINAMEKEN